MKLHIHLDNWPIRADSPEKAQLQAQTTFRVLQFLARSSTSRSPISHQVKTSSSSGCSSTLDVSQWRPTEDSSKGPVSTSALDDQSEHHGQRFAQTSWHAGVHGLLWSGEDGSVFIQSNSGPPQHGARGPGTGPTGFKFHSGLSEMAWWSSPAVLQGLSLVTKETEVTLFTDASSSSWGAIKVHARHGDGGQHLKDHVT